MKKTLSLLSTPFSLCSEACCFLWSILRPFRCDKKKENLLLEKKMMCSLPKDSMCLVQPVLQVGHRMTPSLECSVWLPSILSKNPDHIEPLFKKHLQDIIEICNTTREIRPYLTRFPVDSDAIILHMLFGKREDAVFDVPQKPYISSALYANGKARLSCYIDHDQPMNRLHEEMYSFPVEHIFEEALARIFSFDHSKEETLIQPAKTFKDNVFSHKNLFSFATQFAKSKNLCFLAYDQARHATQTKESSKVCFDMVYCAQEIYMTLKRARDLVRYTCAEHLHFYRNDPFSIAKIKSALHTTDDCIEQENLAFRLTFWDRFIDRMYPPALAEIHVVGRAVYYYTSNDMQKLVLAYKEVLPK